MARRKKGNPVHGWVFLDKPLEMTSTQAVGKVRWLFDARKAGHAGTLDPLATGVLPIALGEATKTIPFMVEGLKRYEFTVSWGKQTSTDDLEGEIVETSDKRPEKEEIEHVLPEFTGTIDQIPPQFSAIKVNGQRAYKLARRGDEVELKPRKVEIVTLELVECLDEGSARFEITCGKGTYIRSLARDIGRKLGCLGHVTALRRVSVGSITQEKIISLDKLEELRHIGADQGLNTALNPLETVLDDIPALAVRREDAVFLKRGQPVLMTGKTAPVEEEAVFVSSGKKPVAIAEIKKGMLHPRRVFNLTSS